MDRRQFFEVTTGALAATALANCAGHRSLAATPLVATPLDAAAFQASRQFAETPFGRIAYVERGTGRAALFVHGYSLNSFQWRGALDRLAPYRRCLALDLMGMGYSEIPEGQAITPSTQADMIAAFLDRLKVRSVDLVANDSGGLITQLFMTRHPNRVRSVLLTNCDTQIDCPPPGFLPFIRIARAGRLMSQVYAPLLSDKSLARAPKGIGGIAYTDPAHLTDEAVDYYFMPLLSSPLRQAQFTALTIGLEDNALAGTEAALHRLNAPAKIVWGMGDTIFSKNSPEWLDHVFARSHGVRHVDNAKLFFPEESPDIIAEEARLLWGVA